MLRRALYAGVAVTALTAATATASAQQFTNMIVYGDSLSDAGRLFALTGGTQPPSPPYFNGRFSNGPVWVELLPAELGFSFSAATDFAAGGAESGSGGPFGVTPQLTASAAVPLNAGTLGVIWAGANDVLNKAATTPPTTLVGSIVTNIGTAVSTVAARGAKTILVGNLPALGSTPGGAAQGAATAFNLNALTNIYNTNLHTTLRGLESSRNVRIVVLNAYGLFADVLANPGTYGLSNVTVPCLGTSGPTGACATTAAADASLFYDPIHPTRVAHQLIADFAAASIDQDFNGARVNAITGFLGPMVLEDARRSVTDRLDTLRAANTRERSTLPNGAYGFVRYGDGDREDSAGVAGFSYENLQYTVGYDTVVGDSFVMGGAFTYFDGDMDADGGRGETNFTAYAFSAYLGYRGDSLWADLTGVGSWENYDILRNTGFGPRPTAAGDLDGNGFLVSLDTGIDFVNDGRMRFGPVLGVRYINSDLDAYEETGAAMLNLATAARSNEGATVAAGFVASGLMATGGSTVTPYLRAVYEKDVDPLNYVTAVTNDVGQVRSASGGTGKEDRILVGAGINVQAGANLALSAGYSGTVIRRDGSDHTFFGRLIYAF